ncbi:hypothetical protein [Euzebya tangerina]|uniref:hypothetical protein n=1 Tax=Euzebya tangerina TaxID=591198 RepID=UPI000E311F23|nr:hypothetical protein [Euzebya tangerina]
MADTFPTAVVCDPAFPTALQRTSDERWVTLTYVACDDTRGVARVEEVPEHVAVVHSHPSEEYEPRVAGLLASPPPDPGRGVHLSWPVDLLHDLEGQVVGYTARRHRSGRTWPLAEFVDPATRATIAPLTTRRHLLRVAKNVAAAAAALHHAGHANIHGRQFRTDERAGIVMVAIDELLPAAGTRRVAQDRRRLANLMVRLLSGHPWPDGALATLLEQSETDQTTAPAADDWYHAIHAAEQSSRAGELSAV